MKHWSETDAVMRRLALLHANGTPCALATVIRVRGSAYRHEGAKLLVEGDGASVGNVSGGCLEADVRAVAERVIATGIAERRRYCGGSDEVAAWDLGIGCEGVVELLVEPMTTTRTDLWWLSMGVPYVAVTRLAGEPEGEMGVGAAPRLACSPASPTSAWGSLGDPALDAWARREAAGWIAAGRSGVVVHEGIECFVEVLLPSPALLVVGAGDDAQVLARLAHETGFRVRVADRREGLLTPPRYPFGPRLLLGDAARVAATLADTGIGGNAPTPDDFAVVMTHDFADDLAYLRVLLDTPLRYIGMLGPRARTERIVAALEREGIGVDRSRLYAPVGLDIGTDGAEQVAIAVIAELLAVRSGRAPRSLRERTAPIHAEDR
jgi:xanthine/CO dehydrogenase XdhC/CoxF family maturation factor